MARGQKATPRAEWSESTREKQNEWKKKNRTQMAADVPRAAGDAFRALCKASGVSVSAALASYIQACILSGSLLDPSALPAAAPVLPADVPAVGVSEIVPPAGTVSAASQVSPAGDACAVTDPAAAPETIHAAGEKSQAGTGTVVNPSISQPFPQKFPESTRPAQWEGPKSPSNCTNPKSQPDMSDITRKSPRAPAHVGNKTASAFPPEETSPQETPPEESPKK